MGKPGPKRTKVQAEKDLIFVADQFVRNVPLRDIAFRLNEKNAAEGFNYSISFQMVWVDVKKMLKRWREERTELIDNLMEIELAKLDKIEAECWDAWEASKQGRLRTKVDGGIVQNGQAIGGNIIDRTIETSVGDVRFLDRIQACIDKRVEMLGLSAPKKISLEGNVGVAGLSALNDQEISAEIYRLLKVVKLPNNSNDGQLEITG